MRDTRGLSDSANRMGRSVPEGDHAGNVIWITPVEISARYGLDEFGRPKS